MPQRARQAIDRLDTPGASVVVTGQQPGFLGGPAYTLFKALSAIALARHVEKTTKRVCVPVFWVAGEDHDLEEIRSVYFPGPEGRELEFRYPGASDRRSVSDYEVGDEAATVLNAAMAHLGGRRHGATACELISLYHGANLASGFARIISALLGDKGLLVLDPRQLRPLTRPLIRQVIEKGSDVLARIEAGREAVRRGGVDPFVAGRFPLFLLEHGQRHYLSPESLGEPGLPPDGSSRKFLYRVGDGSKTSVEDLLERLEREPEAFSTGALLRPLAQEYALPCALTVGGPAEVGYFAQLGPLAEELGLPAPTIALRLQATLLEGKAAQVAAGLDLEHLASARSVDDLLRNDEDEAYVLGFEALAERTERALLETLESLPAGGAAERARRKARAVAREIRRLGQQATKARRESDAVERGRLERLWALAFPNGMLQERRLGFLHFIARHGVDWLDEMLLELEKDPFALAHRIITFGPGG